MRASTRTLAAVLLLTPLAGPATSAAPRVRIEAVALSDQQAPGAPAGVRFSGFRKVPLLTFKGPPISDAGEIAFYASLTGPGVDSSNDEGIDGGSTLGGVTRIALTGDFELNDRGDATFLAQARLDDLSDHPAIFRIAEGRNRPVPLAFANLESSALPAGSRIDHLGDTRINQRGDVLFDANHSGEGADVRGRPRVECAAP